MRDGGVTALLATGEANPVLPPARRTCTLRVRVGARGRRHPGEPEQLGQP